MSNKYDNEILDSDLDAFKQSGILTASITFSGTLGVGVEQDQLSASVPLSSVDFAQILFDNSIKHSGKFRDLSLESATMVHENTRASELQANLYLKVIDGAIQFGGSIVNPYNGSVTLQSTTINFQYIPYEATV